MLSHPHNFDSRLLTSKLSFQQGLEPKQHGRLCEKQAGASVSACLAAEGRGSRVLHDVIEHIEAALQRMPLSQSGSVQLRQAIRGAARTRPRPGRPRRPAMRQTHISCVGRHKALLPRLPPLIDMSQLGYPIQLNHTSRWMQHCAFKATLFRCVNLSSHPVRSIAHASKNG